MGYYRLQIQIDTKYLISYWSSNHFYTEYFITFSRYIFASFHYAIHVGWAGLSQSV